MEFGVGDGILLIFLSDFSFDLGVDTLPCPRRVSCCVPAGSPVRDPAETDMLFMYENAVIRGN